jgi:cytochrome c oxidase assembly factor CtaG
MIPFVSAFLLALLGLYFLAASRISDQIPKSKQRIHLGSFFAGLVVILAVFIPAPDLFGPNRRFTINMVQMLLAIDLAPILILLGIPSVMLESVSKSDFGRKLVRPILTGLISSAILLGWMTPILFESSSGSLFIWVLKQLSYLVAGLLIWFPVAGPIRKWRASYPAQILYIFLLRVPMAIIGVIFAFSEQLIYISRSFALEICAPSSLSDQQTGGLVMWMVGGFFMLAVFTYIFDRWYRENEKQRLNAR